MSEGMIRGLNDLNIPFDEGMLLAFDRYMEGILEYNQKVNLTAITDREKFEEKHYLDSLSVCGLSEYMDAATVIDVGTGGGFPGVPLAIISPEKKFTLADSLMKRIKIIRAITEEMGLTNVKAIHGRAEDLGQKDEYRGSFDLCVSRAVADMAILSEYCLPMVKRGGYFIAYKTDRSDEEVEASEKAIRILGGEIDRIERLNTAGMNHSLVVVKKIFDTPKKYPRKAGTPVKSPLR